MKNLTQSILETLLPPGVDIEEYFQFLITNNFTNVHVNAESHRIANLRRDGLCLSDPAESDMDISALVHPYIYPIAMYLALKVESKNFETQGTSSYLEGFSIKPERDGLNFNTLIGAIANDCLKMKIIWERKFPKKSGSDLMFLIEAIYSESMLHLYDFAFTIIGICKRRFQLENSDEVDSVGEDLEIQKILVFLWTTTIFYIEKRYPSDENAGKRRLTGAMNGLYLVYKLVSNAKMDELDWKQQFFKIRNSAEANIEMIPKFLPSADDPSPSESIRRELFSYTDHWLAEADRFIASLINESNRKVL